MEQQKDYSLLRPFDLEAAKRGEDICYVADRSTRIFIDGPDSKGRVCVKDPVDGEFVLAHCGRYRMAPLCWVEGKPVYKGDVLYQNTAALPGARVVVEGNEDGITDDQGRWNGRSHLTWTPPKVKREVKLLAHLDCDQLFWLREGSLPRWPATRVPSEDKVIEIEEPAGTKGGAT